MTTIHDLYDPDETLALMLDNLDYDKMTGEIPADTTPADLESLNDKLTEAIIVNADAILNLIPQDKSPYAAVIKIGFYAVLGGEKVHVDTEITNVGGVFDDGCDFVINVIPSIKRHNKEA